MYDELLKLMDSYIMEGKDVRYLCCRLKSAWDEPTELLYQIPYDFQGVNTLFCSVPSARDDPPEPTDPEAAKYLPCMSCSQGLAGIDNITLTT